MSLSEKLRKVFPDVSPDYRIEVTRNQLNSMLRTAATTGAEAVMERVHATKLIFMRSGKDVEIVRVKALTDFVYGEEKKSASGK